MKKAKIIMIATFLLIFAAGLAAGRFWRQSERPGPRPRLDGSFVATELGLTPEQTQQMEKIWKDAMEGKRQAHDAERKKLREQRDEAIQQMLSIAQRMEYEDILADYNKKTTDLDIRIRTERDAAFKEAVLKTKTLLTPEQVVKYDKLLSRERPGEGGRRSRGQRPPPPKSDLQSPTPNDSSEQPGNKQGS